MTTRTLFVPPLLVAGAFVSSCRATDCIASDVSCITPTGPAIVTVSNFALNVTSAPANMGAVIFEVSAPQPVIVNISAAARLIQLSSRDSTVWRAMIIGGPKSGTIGRVSATGANVAPPSITIVEVAADESGQYLPIAKGNVNIGLARSN